MTLQYIADTCETTVDEVSALLPAIDELLKPLGLQLLINKKEVAIVTMQTQATLVEKFWKDELKGDLTPAALQVLTLVAYLNGCTRQDISFIRGVQSSQSIRTLTVRGLIDRNGEICTLSSKALQYLGITKVEELPEYETIKKEMLEKLALARAE
ncbi:MAG: segregation and condensation protein [Patescibacteria group bacterium]|nr:segregation and condensation protein [Patescibacteria group bacterium]